MNLPHSFWEYGKEFEPLAHLIGVDEKAEGTVDLFSNFFVVTVVLNELLTTNLDTELNYK
jgi:hypothetical protein